MQDSNTIVKIDRNKYLTLNRCPIMNKKEQNKSDQTALTYKIWAG
jgi:hypothetical protein